ncbi:MAG: PLP-dependent aminotransferase family protein, partial [Streptosporangiales bacterium]|nr:PLP-dependent aminotransferase family protein [Streptosporangiales bacterium]
MPRNVAAELPVVLDRAAGAALPQQLADGLRDRVRTGELRPGWRLPSTRDLARQLRVSRAVVQAAYDQLHAEGWLVSRVGAGTYAAEVGTHSGDGRPRGRATSRTPARPPDPGRRISLEPGVPWTEPVPTATWRRAWREVSAATPPPGYPDPAGLPELRAVVAEHLGRVRGIACSPDEVLVTAGTSHGLRLLLGAGFRPGARVGVEDPGYAAAVRCVRAAGMGVLDCPVDADGLVVAALPARRAPAAVYVTPAHQYPSGGRLPAARRQALVDWARRHDVLVVEDDYDGEFRYDVAPLPALAQLDRGNVVYLGTASKTIGPALRVGWLVAEAHVVRTIARHRASIGDLPPWPAQRALVALFRDGHLDHAVKCARRRYA